MKIDVQLEKSIPLRTSQVRSVCRAVLKEEKIRFHGYLTVAFVANATIQDINRRFLDRDKPTDVIAFPYDDTEENDEEVWGELYISVERAEEQAASYGVACREELARLLIHGVLHLSGYRDHTAALKKSMHAREDYYLEQLNFKTGGSVNVGL